MFNSIKLPWLSYLATAAFLTYLISLELRNPNKVFSDGMVSYATTPISPTNPSVLQLNYESAKSCWHWSECLSNLCSTRSSYPNGYLAIKFGQTDPACLQVKNLVLTLPAGLGIATVALSLLSLIVIGSRLIYTKCSLQNSEESTWRLRLWKWSFAVSWIFSRLLLIATAATISSRSLGAWALVSLSIWSVFLIGDGVISGLRFLRAFNPIVDEDVFGSGSSRDYNNRTYRQLPVDT